MKKLIILSLILLFTSCNTTNNENVIIHNKVDKLINESERKIGYIAGIKFAINHIRDNDSINLNVIAEELYITSKEIDSISELANKLLDK